MKAKANMDAVHKAIDLLGSQSALARALDEDIGTVSAWLRRGNVGPEYCPLIELATGGRVTCEMIHPTVRWDVLRGVCPNCSQPRA